MPEPRPDGTMATEAWQAARDGVLELWRRVQPGRADAAAAQLDVSHQDVLAAGVADDHQTLSELRAQWAGLFRRLILSSLVSPTWTRPAGES
ncbi:hypothetical protein ACFVT1_38590 [Streptomyces sp. NPDC057963]|uniref:hypothetical protein n=1 Tax=Streptomyces sp. NPDC057963 TaxID=3346290 RepID=UPI0036EA77A9